MSIVSMEAGGDGSAYVGHRIRRLRRQRKVSQAELAGTLGISPSYLNLIEHNRRRLTVPMLLKLASHFGVEAGELAEADAPRLAGDLMEIFGDDLFAEADLTNQDIRELATANPAIGRAVVLLFDKFRALRQNAGGTASTQQGVAPVASDAVSDFLQANSNHFPTLEAAAERIRVDIDRASDGFDAGLKSYLLNAFGLQWKSALLPPGVARRLHPERGELLTSEALSPESAAFVAAQQLGLLAADGAIEALAASATLPEDATPVVRNALAAYMAAALVMPYEPFLRSCRETRYDIERIAHRFRTSFEQVCHRMTTLQRPGAAGIPLHLVRTDIAGNISKRFSLSGIHIPRHTGACPRWNIYAAFLHPSEINVQVSQMPEGQRYFCIAKVLIKGGHHYNEPKRYFSIGLGCHIGHASGLIYADTVETDKPDQAVPIGIGCRACPRPDCAQRAHPPAGHRVQIDESQRMESFYGRI